MVLSLDSTDRHETVRQSKEDNIPIRAVGVPKCYGIRFSFGDSVFIPVDQYQVH